MTFVYPDHCSFSIDDAFSSDYKQKIKLFIDQQYQQSKDPQSIILNIEQSFNGVKAVCVDMNDLETLRFSIAAYNPLFLLNNQHVVCQTGLLFEKDMFDKTRVDTLEQVTYQMEPGVHDMKKLAYFIESLDADIVHNFAIRWLGKHQVWLHHKQQKDFAMLARDRQRLTKDHINQCFKIKDQVQSNISTRRDIKWVCDVRFDKQIVVFSTKRGE
jgi:hypothetical protein